MLPDWIAAQPVPPPDTASAEVSAREAAVRLPVKKPLPLMERDTNGEVVPTPTFPPALHTFVPSVDQLPTDPPPTRLPAQYRLPALEYSRLVVAAGVTLAR